MTDKERLRRTRTASEQLREYARGELAEAGHKDVSRAAGLVQDDEVRDLLIFAEQSYNRHRDPDDPEYWSTSWSSDRLNRAASRTASRAVEVGNVSQMSYIRGWVEYDSDVAGLRAIQQLEDWLCTSEATKLVYIAALMGRGKTDMSLLLLQIVNHYYERLRGTAPEDLLGTVPEPEFGANLRVETPEDDPDVAYIPDYDRLSEWSEDGSSDDEKWFIFDEASTELTAQSGSNAQTVAEVMGPFVKKMRKSGVNMIAIGHDRRDVHPAIRSLADFIDKTGRKTASFYSGIKNREPAGHLFDVEGLPPTSWDYDTDDLATWDWGSALDDVEQEVDGYVLDDRDLKRMAANRAASVYESVEGVTMTDAVDLVSGEKVSISTDMLRSALDGAYQEVPA